MTNKTVAASVPVADFLARSCPPARQDEAARLDAVFREVTGFDPVVWGASIIGYGRYHYRYDSGREGDYLATGFAPRKAALTIYIMPGYTDFGHILNSLGKYKRGKSCLYVNRLTDIDLGVLAHLVRAGLDDLGLRWPVLPR